MKKLGDPPFFVSLVIYLVTFTIWMVIAHDFFFTDGPSDQRSIAQSTAGSSPAPSEKKALTSPSNVAPAAVAAEPREPAREKPADDPVVQKQKADAGLPVSKPTEIIRPVDSSKGPAKLPVFPGKSLRADDANMPTGDLRTGADAKPMGSLRSPADSNIGGSLRPDDRSLPTGSLRPDEGSLPTGSLR